MSRRSIYIADSYSLNTGDVGILFATLAVIQKNIKDVTVYIEASHPLSLSEYGSDFIVFPRIFDISEVLRRKRSKSVLVKVGFIGLYDSVTFLLLAILRRLGLKALWIVRKSRRSQALAIAQSSLWLSSGGGFLSSYYRMEFRTYGYFIARIMRVPYMIFAQSVGPFFGAWHISLAKSFLNAASAITIREPDSFSYLQQIGIKQKITLTADIALYLPTAQPPADLFDGSSKYVAICIKSSSPEYTRLIAEAAGRLSREGFKIFFVSHTPSDDAAVKDLQQSVGSKSQTILFGMDPRRVKGLYSKCVFIISSRMHAIIFSVEQKVPWVGIGYEPKFLGLSQQLAGTGVLIMEKDLSSNTLEDAINRVQKISKATVARTARASISKSFENVRVLKKTLEKSSNK